MFGIKPNILGSIKTVAGLYGCAEAIAIANMVKENHKVIVLCHDPAGAIRLADQLTNLIDAELITHIVGWEVLPYDSTSPPKAIASARISALAKLNNSKQGVFITAITDALFPTIPANRLFSQALKLAIGKTIDIQKLAEDLIHVGCVNVDRVRAAGEFAIYGGQIDLFPGGLEYPIRIVLDFDRIEEIRKFDPSTQLSTGHINNVDMLPAREYPLDDEMIVNFRQRWREKFSSNLANEVYLTISKGIEAEGAEFYLPLFYNQATSIFDYLKEDNLLWLQDDLETIIDEFMQLTNDRYTQTNNLNIACLSPEELFISKQEFFKKIKQYSVIQNTTNTNINKNNLGTIKPPSVSITQTANNPYQKVVTWLAEQSQQRIVFTWSNQARKKIVINALKETKVTYQDTYDVAGNTNGVFLLETGLIGGFIYPKGNLALITEAELHDYIPAPKSLRHTHVGGLADLEDFKIGDLVIHKEQGVARYHGLTSMEINGSEEEFIKLEFANDVNLYVAVVHCNLIARYRQPDHNEEVKLHTIGSNKWQKMKKKAEKAAFDTAAYLLELYAKRANTQSENKYFIDEDELTRFCEAFLHAETADQARVSAEVFADLSSTQPMDRLICGDVGFGKTEIAMRAAWLVWSNHKQVALIAPTTLLADQLYRSFVDRFELFNPVIHQVSSLKSAKENKAILNELSNGEPAIVIGTHALLGKDVKLPNLGLVIIDEEHRFGVRQKEKLRSLRAEVDLLALSATPIPRTLSMALEGLRDISIIATPPPDRLAVRTFVATDSDSMIKEALIRELARGGQVFFVYHRVQSIRLAKERLNDLVPNARVAIAHGQMPHAQLEAVMHKFYRGEIDVLVSTSIIESGLDVANANTIIIPRAEMFGLAQLHQLRGRVGRSVRQGYAYFLVPNLEKNKNSKLAARLDTIVESAELGGGHYIAVRDLEIRGAGEILGEAQSGTILNVGVETFKQMLAQAQRKITGKEVAIDCEVDFGGQARLPSNYCASPVERMRIYQNLANATSINQLEDLREVIADRFGPIPFATRLLIDCHFLRLDALKLGINRIKAQSNGIRFNFNDNPVCINNVIELVNQNKEYKLNADSSLWIANEGEMIDQLKLANKICEQLAQSEIKQKQQILN